MKITLTSLLLFFILNSQVVYAEQYLPNSGDKELDEVLIAIDKKVNRKNRSKQSQFVDKVAAVFQVPPQKVEALFNHYEFNAADVLMSVSIADVSGEPLQNIVGVYFKNKSKGWKYTLLKMNIDNRSKLYIQIKKDMNIEF